MDETGEKYMVSDMGADLVGHLVSAGQILRLPLSRRHLQRNKNRDTSTKICLHFKMISIYILYELVHVCSCPPRTPTPHASLLSFLKIVRKKAEMGMAYISGIKLIQ